MDLNIQGRGRLVARAQVYEGSVTIRIDDFMRDEFWAEVTLTVEELEQLRHEALLEVRYGLADPSEV